MTSLRTSLSLALAALFALPVAAGAAVTATTISEPVSDPSVLVYVEPAGSTLKVSGTSNGGVGRLDLRCEGAATPVVFDNVRPTAAGVWTTTLSVAQVSRLTPRTCYLHAVPHGNAGTNRNAFPGKRVMFQRSRVTAVVGGPNNGVPYDFRYWAPQLMGRSIWQSVSNCGLAGASTITPDTLPRLGLGLPVRRLHRHQHLRAAPACSSIASTPSRRTARPRSSRARPTRSACWRRRPPWRPTRARATSSSARPRTCCAAARTPAALPATPQTCSSFVSAGVKLDRVIIQQGDGRQALVTDTWSATDGRHHEIDAFYEHRLGGSAPVVSFPWAGGFTSYPPGYTQKPPPSAPFSFFTRASPSAADGDVNNPQGAITLQDRPTTLRFRTSAALWTQYVRTVTPATPTHISFGFSWAITQADLATQIGDGRARARTRPTASCRTSSARR